MVKTRALERVRLVEVRVKDLIKEVPIVNERIEGDIANGVLEVRNPNQDILQQLINT